jgi:hypothetical protein
VCRTTCLLLSSIRPQLDAHNIPLVGVTFQTGDELKAFLDAGYFNGELYLDEERKAYQATETSGLIGFFKLFADLFTKLSPAFRHRLSKTTGNSRGIAAVFSTIAAIKGVLPLLPLLSRRRRGTRAQPAFSPFLTSNTPFLLFFPSPLFARCCSVPRRQDPV